MLRKSILFLKDVFVPKSVREVVVGAPIIVAIVAVAYAAFLDREPILERQTEVLTPVVMQGDEFRISHQVTWNSRCLVTGFRFIIDGDGFQHTVSPDFRFVEAGADRFEVRIAIPTAASPGRAEYKGIVQYECNWLQRIFPFEQPIAPHEFLIVAAPPTSASNYGTAFCPAERPVFVQSYCRSGPGG